MASERREFVREHTGADLSHVAQYSFDPAVLPGNIENFIGVAQVPIGLAGPIHIVGEHAQGDFYVPLATSEGTLVASYNRGMRLLTEGGGVKTAVVEESMQRAPVFIFSDAVQAREFGRWVTENFTAIKSVAEATTHTGHLIYIGQYQVGPLRYLRFNYTTGDAAGQNMCGKATFAACEWIKNAYPGGAKYILSGGIDTDKKHSHLNMLLTRGRRVVAEAVIPKDLFKEIMGIDTRDLFWSRQIQMAGAFLAASANNGAHAANGLAALFIATGQDVADISRIPRRHQLQPASRQRRLLLVHHPDFPDRRHLRRRNRSSHSEAMPGNVGLLRHGQSEKVRRNLRRGGAGRRNLAGRCRNPWRLGHGARAPGPQPPPRDSEHHSRINSSSRFPRRQITLRRVRELARFQLGGEFLRPRRHIVGPILNMARCLVLPRRRPKGTSAQCRVPKHVPLCHYRMPVVQTGRARRTVRIIHDANLAQNYHAFIAIHPQSLGHTHRDVLVLVAREIDALCVHAGQVPTDLIGAAALVRIAAHQQDTDGQRHQKNRTQHVQWNGRAETIDGRASHGCNSNLPALRRHFQTAIIPIGEGMKLSTCAVAVSGPYSRYHKGFA